MHGHMNAKVFLIIIRINSDHTEQHSPFAVCNGGIVRMFSVRRALSFFFFLIFRCVFEDG